jgi:DNA replicative helicase MCM subunit Mcm2 (Cdc46/Mcm family)
LTVVGSDERRRFKKRDGDEDQKRNFKTPIKVLTDVLETEMRSGEATKLLDVNNVVRDVSPVDALVSKKVVECEDNAEMYEEDSEKGSERKAGLERLSCTICKNTLSI